MMNKRLLGATVAASAMMMSTAFTNAAESATGVTRAFRNFNAMSHIWPRLRATSKRGYTQKTKLMRSNEASNRRAATKRRHQLRNRRAQRG